MMQVVTYACVSKVPAFRVHLLLSSDTSQAGGMPGNCNQACLSWLRTMEFNHFCVDSRTLLLLYLGEWVEILASVLVVYWV
jgi:hypothetical protein